VEPITGAVVLFMSAAFIGTDAYGACPPDSAKPQSNVAKGTPTKRDCLNLNSLPQISDNVASAKAPGAKARPVYVPPSEQKYEGPTLGLTKPEPGVKPVPVIGYRWSLE
jgi:hypothetical protein